MYFDAWACLPQTDTEGGVSNGKNGRSKVTAAGKLEAHAGRIRRGDSGSRDWKTSGNPNGRNSEQEEKEFYTSFHKLRGGTNRVRSPTGDRPRIGI